MARLERALGQYMLDTQTSEAGYSECATPLLVSDEAAFGTTQLPKFSDDLFQTTNGRWLIHTAETSRTNAAGEHILAEDDPTTPPHTHHPRPQTNNTHHGPEK